MPDSFEQALLSWKLASFDCCIRQMSSGKDQGTDGGDKVRLVTHMLQDIDKATCAAARRTLLWSTKEQAGAPARRQHLLNVLDSLGAQDQAPWSAQCAVHRQAQQVCP